ncbi:hypothetical protein QVD17_42153 [Tagetes erecta]|uniref:Uncharacterized protein n=1 Tax=Tagetes erecta TaxID=13708 RepID=A0AAD8JLE3_TARER|nr:hypothetical protein QVD17_42153 [Tagetes erecta]
MVEMVVRRIRMVVVENEGRVMVEVEYGNGYEQFNVWLIVGAGKCQEMVGSLRSLWFRKQHNHTHIITNSTSSSLSQSFSLVTSNPHKNTLSIDLPLSAAT